MHLLDLSHTSHTSARTGIQRVARALYGCLGDGAQSICHDPHLRAWRELQPWELRNLDSTVTAAGRRGEKWPVVPRVRSRLRRWIGDKSPMLISPGILSKADGLIVPELFSPAVGKSLRALFDVVRGPRVSVFHDAIALKLPEFTPKGTVARFPPYLRELLIFDGIAANSADSRDSLLDYWKWLGVENHPEVVSIPLGIHPPAAAAPAKGAGEIPLVLSVGSIEGRKNHLALLEACEVLWSGGERFALRLAGMAVRQTGQQALDRIAALQAAGRPLRYDGPVDDAALETAYAASAFTVYPSKMEGFGLPVIESLSRGRPCICSGRGALGESARGGGCIALDSMDSASLSTAIGRLLKSPVERASLEAAARGRTFKTWASYTQELTNWMSGLFRRK